MWSQIRSVCRKIEIALLVLFCPLPVLIDWLGESILCCLFSLYAAWRVSTIINVVFAMQNGNGNDFKCEWVYILPAAAIYPVFHCSNGCAALDHWCACSLRRAAAAAAQYARIHLLCVCAYTRAACGFHYACDLTLSLSLPPSLSLSGFIFICSSWNRTDIATSLTIQYMHIFLHRQATTLFITIKTQTLSYANHVCVVECYERRSRKENHTQKTYTQQSTHYL